VKKTENLLLDGLFLDQIGWAEDYRYDLSGEGGQPPSIYSHNIYIQHDSTDVTLRDSITMRGAVLRGADAARRPDRGQRVHRQQRRLNMLGGD
jgi:hypothetical protein